MPRKLQLEYYFRWGNFNALIARKHLFETANIAKSLFGLNLDTSLFFRGSTFDTKHFNGLELSEEKISDYNFAQEKDQQEQLISGVQHWHTDSKLDSETRNKNLERVSKSALASFLYGEKDQVDKTEIGALPAMGMSPLILTSRQNHGDNMSSPRRLERPGSYQESHTLKKNLTGKTAEIYFFNEEERTAVNRFRTKPKQESDRSSNSAQEEGNTLEKEKPRSFRMGRLSKLKRKNSARKARHMHEKVYKESAEIIQGILKR